MSKVRLAVLAGLVLLLGSPGWAGYISNYSRWSKMSDAGRSIYAQGMFDAFADLLHADRDWYQEGLINCVDELELTGSMIAEAMDQWYKSNPDRWGSAAFSAFNVAVVWGPCRPFMSAARRELNRHSPYEPATRPQIARFRRC